MTCDVCGVEVVGELHEARVARPSDPTDMCCVMASCAGCADQIGAKPASFWDEWIEGEGARLGFVFLS